MSPIRYNKTKLIATVGPASDSKEALKELILAGVDVFRLNFSHGDHKDKQRIINIIHELNKELDSRVAILADLQGPKIRLRKVEEGSFLEKGKKIKITTDDVIGTSKKLSTAYLQFAQDVKQGDRILMDDGKLELSCTKTNHINEIEAEVIYGGPVSSRKGINLPNTSISTPSLTKKDKTDLEFILTQENVNWIALSFTREARDIIQLKSIIDYNGHNAKVIAKIEKPEAIDNLEEIINVSDGIMVARGDLGVEVAVERMPQIQKRIVRECKAAFKPVIIATQMMESMITNASPTRAEVTDVANAVYDGADTVMLSGETAMGKHPVRVVEVLSNIVEKAEIEMKNKKKEERKFDKENDKYLADVICWNACNISNEIDAKAIIAHTKTGYTAYTLSSFRPNANIFVLTESPEIINALSLVWGVRAYHYTNFNDTDRAIADIQQMLKKRGMVELGDIVVNTGSMPIAERGSTNTIKVDVVV